MKQGLESVISRARPQAYALNLACYRLRWAKLASPMEFGHSQELGVPLTRAEGPAVNSPAREGGGLEDPESEVRRTGTPTVPHLRRSWL